MKEFLVKSYGLYEKSTGQFKQYVNETIQAEWVGIEGDTINFMESIDDKNYIIAVFNSREVYFSKIREESSN